MNIVAITRLATSVEVEAEMLAAMFGTLAYDERLKLRAGVPAIVLQTPDESRAAALVHDLRERGHDVVACESSSVVASSAMTSLREFRFEPEALVAAVGTGERELPWNDLAALVRATHRTHTQKVEHTVEKKFSLGRALATGGLVVSKKTDRDEVSRTDASEPVLYLFRRGGQPPWLLAQHRAHYGALGPRIQPTAAPNFRLTVEAIRDRARFAAFDERLLARKGTVAELDLLAHLVASSA